MGFRVKKQASGNKPAIQSWEELFRVAQTLVDTAGSANFANGDVVEYEEDEKPIAGVQGAHDEGEEVSDDSDVSVSDESDPEERKAKMESCTQRSAL